MRELITKYIWCRRAGLVYIIWKKNNLKSFEKPLDKSAVL